MTSRPIARCADVAAPRSDGLRRHAARGEAASAEADRLEIGAGREVVGECDRHIDARLPKRPIAAPTALDAVARAAACAEALGPGGVDGHRPIGALMTDAQRALLVRAIGEPDDGDA